MHPNWDVSESTRMKSLVSKTRRLSVQTHYCALSVHRFGTLFHPIESQKFRLKTLINQKKIKNHPHLCTNYEIKTLRSSNRGCRSCENSDTAQLTFSPLRSEKSLNKLIAPPRAQTARGIDHPITALISHFPILYHADQFNPEQQRQRAF
eukprot:c35320_g1_i1 orf=27-476(-)